MRTFSLLAISLTVSLLFSETQARNVHDISECPPLKPRRSPPKDVTDLRIDDIKVIASLGDSTMAGFGLQEIIDGTTPLDALEIRGKNYATGGDPGAKSLARFTTNYQPELKGASVGQIVVTRCNYDYCALSDYNPDVDRLNGAKSGAIAKRIKDELDYVIPYMKEYPGVDFENDWKLIILHIGNNDQCDSCTVRGNESTPEVYGSYIDTAIERISQNIPKAIVTLVGNLNVSTLYNLASRHPEYCPTEDATINYLTPKVECPCLSSPELMLGMDAVVAEYNKRLIKIAEKYKAKKGSNFAVVYQPAGIDFRGFPINYLSPLDCFHPSIHAQEYFAKILWNSLFRPSIKKQKVFEYDENLIYCPKNSDRISTK
ncbi:hypothetical protein F4703DRAFT_1605132 [Phycomyces blakesleeanus]